MCELQAKSTLDDMRQASCRHLDAVMRLIGRSQTNGHQSHRTSDLRRSARVQAESILKEAPGVSIINDRAANRFPMPLDASHNDDVYVGRIRRDISRSDCKGLDLFVCGDQIKKGAALNAVQIAELLL